MKLLRTRIMKRRQSSSRERKRSHWRRGCLAIPRLECLGGRTLLSGGLDPAFSADGQQTIAFNLGDNNEDRAFGVALQPDGKIVMVGVAVSAGGEGDFAIARLNADGSPDTSFNGDGKQTVDINPFGADFAIGVAIQPDGKIVAVGTAQDDPGPFDFAIARLNADGSLDTSFDTDGKQTVAFNLGGSNDDEGRGVVLQPDGKIVVVGSVDTASGDDTDFGIARLNADGSLDTSFDTDGKQIVAFNLGGFNNNDSAFGVALQPDGKIVAVGSVDTSPGDDTAFGIARLNSDGSPDTGFDGDGKQTVTFDLGVSNRAQGVVIQPDGKIVVAGEANISGTGDDFAIARLNVNGSLDTRFDGDGKQTVDFNSGEDTGRAVALQPDGKVVVVGEVDSLANEEDFGIARLNPDGSVDKSFDGDGKRTVAFNIGGGLSDEARAVALQPDGKIVVAGNASISSMNTDFAVARLLGANVRFMALGGAPGRVQVFRPDGNSLGSFFPYASSGYDGGVTVAMGDFNSDGVEDLVTGATSGNPHTKVYNGAALDAGIFFINPESHVLAQGFPYAVNFDVGSNVAAGDVNGDGFADLITGAVPGNPHVIIYDGKAIVADGVIPQASNDPSILAQGFAYGTNFNIGANVAAGDVNGDGLEDVITGASAGNPHTKVFDARTILTTKVIPTSGNDPAVRAEFFPYALQFNVGAFVSAGDYDFDGFDDVVTGASIGNPEVRAFSGKDMAKGIFNVSASLLDIYFAFELSQNIGVSVAAADFTADGKADVLVGTRSGTPRHRVFKSNFPSPATLLPGFDVTDVGFTGALYVGA